MRMRSMLSASVGIVQSIVATAVILLACLLRLNLLGIQELLGEASSSVDLYFLVLLAMGFPSLASGLFLVDDWLEQRS